MQDLFLSVVGAFDEPPQQSNFIVFRSSQPAVPMQEGAGYFKKCKQYAKGHGAYLVTGLMNIGNFLCLCMFSPKGKLCGAQRALFLSPANQVIYQTAGNLALFDTPYGKVFLCVDSDIYRPEVQRHARLSGCQIVVCAQWFDPDEAYHDNKLFTGGWGAAQTNNFFVACANNHNAAVCAPFLTTVDNTGFLVKPCQSAFTTFNVSRLADIPCDYHSSHFNTELFAAHRGLL